MGKTDMAAHAALIRERLARYDRLARERPTEAIQSSYIRFKFSHVVPRALRALTRMEEGMYGICEKCDGDIGKDRLRAVPAATKCLACQEREENSPLFLKKTTI